MVGAILTLLVIGVSRARERTAIGSSSAADSRAADGRRGIGEGATQTEANEHAND
jgi:hypothetical protein